MPGSESVENVIIIGAGPAGYTAALYAARADLTPLLLAGPLPGGQLMITTDVENYPGFPSGILGPEMMELFRKQAEHFGARIEYQTVTSVDFNQTPFKITTDQGEHHGHSVVIATGASAKWIGLEGEKTFGGYGVSACATCDGFFFRGKNVIVVGGGDTAMEEAHYLTRHAAHVTIVHRRDTFRASKIMQDRVLSHPKIDVVWDSAIDDIIGATEPVKKLSGVRIKNIKTGETHERPIDGVFIAIGHSPNSSLFGGVLDMDEVGYINTKPGSTRTNVPGVFACGDVADSVYRQAVSAAGTGCMAAIDAERYLAGGH
jgi:thioredoxin reductase (NADPH)